MRLYLVTRLLWTLGLRASGVAVSWLVYQLAGGVTQGSLDLGLMGLVQFVPVLLLWPLTGPVVDQFDRRRVLVACALVTAIATGLLAIFSSSTASIFGLLVLAACSRAFSAPASATILSHLVSGEEFTRAVALNSSIFQVGATAGPVLGGLLCAWLGAEWTCGLSGGMIGIAGIVLLFLPPCLPEPQEKTEVAQGVWTSAWEGFGYVRSRPELLGAITLDLFAVLLGGATALLPVFANDILGGEADTLGWLRAAPAIGAVGTSLYLSRFPIRGGAGSKLLGSVFVFGAATVVFGASTWLWLSLLALFLTGVADEISVVIRQTIVQGRTPDRLRGRVSSVNFLFVSVSNELGMLESGLVGAWLGPVGAVVFGGAGAMLVAIGFSRVKELREIDRL